jgi:putative tricarboxylic transport membrane protein
VTGTIALLLPISYSMSPLTALIMFCGIYAGTMYGGSTTSILVNVPGEGASVVTMLEGHKMALRGRAGAALAIAAIGSFIAGTLGVVGVTFFAPFLARTALKFGPPEYFAITVLGLLLLSNLSGKSPFRSILMVLVGIMIGTVGVDPVTGLERFSFGNENLLNGIDFVVIIMGLFGMAEIIQNLCVPQDNSNYQKITLRELYPTRTEFKRSVLPVFRGGIIGFLMGLLPGPTATISTFVSYKVEKSLGEHKYPDWQEGGAIEGVAGPESANNAASSSQMIPLLSLGIPFSSSAAILLAGFMVHGIRPGPLLVTSNPQLFWGLIASMYVGNLMCLILNLPLVGFFASLLKIPSRILMPLVALITFTGGYAINNNLFDILALVVFGVLGYCAQKAGYEMAPLAIGAFLGPQLEKGLVQSMIMSDGDFSRIMARPIAGTMIWLIIAVIVYMAANIAIEFIRTRNQRGRSVLP